MLSSYQNLFKSVIVQSKQDNWEFSMQYREQEKRRYIFSDYLKE